MNNDISNFEKVVLVDQIPSEQDAKDLSLRYPFVLFLTDSTTDTPHAFSNIWKGGNRFTKFNNVNPRAKSVNLDTYSIDLDFDLETGLLSLTAVAKVDNYKVVGFLYKSGNEQYRTFLNKNELENLIAYDNSSEGRRTITNITYGEWEADRDSFENFTSSTFESTLNTIYEIDAADNKFYMIVSFESEKQDTLFSVPATAYSIYSNDTQFSVTANPAFAEDKLKQVIEIENMQAKNALINKILKYTDKVEYNDSYQRCVIYEITVNENIEPDSVDDQTKVSFSYESLKNLAPIDVQLTYAYINPISFSINALVNGEWVPVDLTSEKENYFIPGETSQFNIEILPQNVRKLRLDTILTTRMGQSTNDFRITESNDLTGSAYNYDINVANSDTTNLIQFSLTTPSEFTVDTAKRSDLEIKISKKIPIAPGFAVIDSADWKHVKVSQYIFKRLELPNNTWSYTGISTSGNEIDYLLPENSVYALFTNDAGTVSKKRIIPKNDDELKINLIMHPKNNLNVEVATINTPLILDAENISDTVLENNRIGHGDSVNPNGIQKQITLIIPWIKQTTISGNQTTDYIYGWYRYHGYETKTHYKYIKEDNLVSISIKKNIGTISAPSYIYGMNFTKPIYGGSEDLYIEKLENAIIFKYANGQEIDGYHWIFNDNLSELKSYLQVYSTIAGQQNSQITNIPAASISIANGKIKINSLNDINNALKYYAYIKYGNLESDTIDASAQRLMVDWWMYIGPYNASTGNPTIEWASRDQNNMAFTKDTNLSQAASGTNNETPTSIHKGGWIHFGTVDLSTTKFPRYNVNGDQELPSRSKIIWESLSDVYIDVPSVESGDDYLIVIPNELQIEHVFGVIGDFVRYYNTGDHSNEFTGNLGNYTGYSLSNLDDNGFNFAITHV